MNRIASFFRLIWQAVLDFLFPPRCLACGEGVQEIGVCPACWKGLCFLTEPCCACCGQPFDYDLGTEALCGACMTVAPPFAKARAALAYNDASRKLVVGIKHSRLQAMATLAGWMQRAGASMLEEADLVCVVPLHRWRLMKRGYNQSALLAARLQTPARIEPELLVRTRATPSQGGLSRSGRQRNIRGAFAVHARYLAQVKGKRIVLVDDVFTTGATLGECCRVLKRAGAGEVSVLTAARVLSRD